MDDCFAKIAQEAYPLYFPAQMNMRWSTDPFALSKQQKTCKCLVQWLQSTTTNHVCEGHIRFPAFAKTMEVQLVFHRYPVAKADANVNQNELLDKSHHVNLQDFRTVDVLRLDAVSFQYNYIIALWLCAARWHSISCVLNLENEHNRSPRGRGLGDIRSVYVYGQGDFRI